MKCLDFLHTKFSNFSDLGSFFMLIKLVHAKPANAIMYRGEILPVTTYSEDTC